mmetsp:Transcript_31366/g.37939  ORF Transcript_31366/g.37939 Transcript_31366/m.37939 type:complete len:215 (-) Transcript_31366:771-1415(-)
MVTVSQSGMRPEAAAAHVPMTEIAAIATFCMMIALVWCEISITKGSIPILEVSLCRSRTSATLAAATDGELATAMPTSAAASAGASLIPSPTITTPGGWRPFAMFCWRSSSTICCFCSGNRSVRRESSDIPICFATFPALFALSPVSMSSSMPSLAGLKKDCSHLASLSSETAALLRSPSVSTKYSKRTVCGLDGSSSGPGPGVCMTSAAMTEL